MVYSRSAGSQRFKSLSASYSVNTIILVGNLYPNVPFKQMHPEERSFHYPSTETVKKPNSYEALPPSTSPHLLDCSQDLADLEDLVHLTVAREKRSESVQLCHNASNSPQVNGGAVSGRSEQHLRSSVPGRRAVSLKPAIRTNTHKHYSVM